ncbi:MAG: hypothetical protein RL394_1363, partial [Bacteroidota bacterium]
MNGLAFFFYITLVFIQKNKQMKLTSWALSFLLSLLQIVAFSQQDRFAKIGGQEYKLRKDE